MAKVHSFRKRMFAVLLIAAVAFAFSPLAADTAHADTYKLTLYKGQKVTLKFKNKASVTCKSSKAKIAQIKKTKKNNFVITAKKAGKATITATAKDYYPNKYKITVKGSYPAGSDKRPIALGSKWKAIKSKNGKKQINAKVTVWKGADARSQVLNIEKAPTDGTAYFDRSYWNDTAVKSGRTFYLIKFDYKIVKGYSSKKSAYLSRLLGGNYYNKKWKKLSLNTDYKDYLFSNVKNSSDDVSNGATGTYYVAVFVKNSVKELRCDYVGNILDYQDLGKLATKTTLITTGCVSLKLP